MYIDMTKLHQAFKELNAGFNELVKELAKITTYYMDGIYEFIDEWEKIVIKISQRQKFKPILKLSPNKTYIRDKRNINYYCRDNC